MSRLALAIALLLIACSPEATRSRGAGPGADVGNHGSSIELHGPTDISHDTPRVGQATRK
jgi:hypothetical protein